LENLNENVSAVEAVLFASGEPIEIKTLCIGLDMTTADFQEVLDALTEKYKVGGGLMLMRYNDSLQICTRPQYMNLIERILQPVRKQTLTQAALETLSVVAYRQPVTRLEIEQMRGVQCDHAIYTLLSHGLIEEVGRKETVGRPILYGTTEGFLRHFALSSLSELPEVLPETEEEKEFTNI